MKAAVRAEASAKAQPQPKKPAATETRKRKRAKQPYVEKTTPNSNQGDKPKLEVGEGGGGEGGTGATSSAGGAEGSKEVVPGDGDSERTKKTKPAEPKRDEKTKDDIITAWKSQERHYSSILYIFLFYFQRIYTSSTNIYTKNSAVVIMTRRSTTKMLVYRSLQPTMAPRKVSLCHLRCRMVPQLEFCGFGCIKNVNMLSHTCSCEYKLVYDIYIYMKSNCDCDNLTPPMSFCSISGGGPAATISTMLRGLFRRGCRRTLPTGLPFPSKNVEV